MASIEDLGPDRDGYRRWRVSVYLGRTPTGRRIRHTERITASSRRDAERHAARIEAAALEANTRPTSNTGAGTLTEFSERWLEHLADIGRAPSTLAGYRLKLSGRIIPALGPIPLAKLTPGDLNGLYRTMRADDLAPATIRQVHAILRAMLRQACRWELLERNVADLANPPTVHATAQHLPEVADVLRILDLVKPPMVRAAVRVLAATGARRGEVLALTWSDVDLTAGTLRIDESVVQLTDGRHIGPTKTKTTRTVTLDPDTLTLFADLRQAAEAAGKLREHWPVFAWSPGEPCIPPSTVSQAFKRAAKLAGVPMPLKNLRHLNATLLLDAGVPLPTVAGRLGHADGGRITLARYAQRTNEADRTAATVLGNAFTR